MPIAYNEPDSELVVQPLGCRPSRSLPLVAKEPLLACVIDGAPFCGNTCIYIRRRADNQDDGGTGERMNAYLIDHNDRELHDIIDRIEHQVRENPKTMHLWPKNSRMHTRLIAPAQIAGGAYLPMRWGYVRRGKAERFIKRDSALSNSVVFSQIALEQRCLIPANGYYVFVNQGTEIVHYMAYCPEGPLYFAGCYINDRLSPVQVFVILLQPAENSVKSNTGLMPVIVPPEHRESWLHERPSAIEYSAPKLCWDVIDRIPAK